MSQLRRTIGMQQLESRALLAASVALPSLLVHPPTSEPQWVASIEVENAAGIRAATVEIHYDQNVLAADSKSVRAGSLWNGKGLAIANVNEQDGMITAFVFATQDMDLSAGTLIDIDFMFHDPSHPKSPAPIAIGQLRLNEGDIPVPTDSSASNADDATLRRSLPDVGDSPADTPSPADADAATPAAPAEKPPTALSIARGEAAGGERAVPPQAVTPANNGEDRLYCTPWPSRAESGVPAASPTRDAPPPASQLGESLAELAPTLAPATPKSAKAPVPDWATPPTSVPREPADGGDGIKPQAAQPQRLDEDVNRRKPPAHLVQALVPFSTPEAEKRRTSNGGRSAAWFIDGQADAAASVGDRRIGP